VLYPRERLTARQWATVAVLALWIAAVRAAGVPIALGAFTGLISSYSSTSGVVLPAFLLATAREPHTPSLRHPIETAEACVGMA
jgi:uncharacterized membrane protein